MMLENTALISIALSQYGVTEYLREAHNPMILDYFKEIGHKWVTTDETAWCSAFVNWVALKAHKPRSGKLTARSWLKVGTPTMYPVLGDIVILWRSHPNSWKGHVGFFINFSKNKKHIYILGGNQRNSVCIQAYDASRLLGYRRL